MPHAPRRSFLATSSALLLAASSPVDVAAKPEKKRGALVMLGGGRPYNADALDEFWQLAGGKEAQVVVIPTAHADMDSPQTSPRRIALTTNPWRERGVRSIAIRHTLQREEADDERFVAPLREATGVWISGGDQNRLLATYRGTRLHRELVALLERGGVIGGSSAGTAVQSELAILGARGKSPLLDAGFKLFPNSVVDQHFLARGRQWRLERALQKHPKLLGFGIDEHTALIVEGETLRVVGKSTVSLYRQVNDRLDHRMYASGERIEVI